jgi:hypothetical protein
MAFSFALITSLEIPGDINETPKDLLTISVKKNAIFDSARL